MPNIRKTTQNDIRPLAQAFREAFSTYEVPLHMNEERFLRMLRRNGFTHEFSYVAEEDGRIVGFLINGCRTSADGELRLYDTGTGVIAPYRGRGIAKRLFQTMLSDTAGQRATYRLEVLKSNAPARAVYEKQGFAVSRELICLKCPTAQLPKCAGSDGYTLTEAGVDENTVLSDAVLALLASGKPSWQNELPSLIAAGGHTLFLLKEGETPKALAAVALGSGDIAELAVKDETDAEQALRVLMQTIRTRTRAKALKVFNLDGGAVRIRQALEGLGFAEFARQNEMVRTMGTADERR